MSISTSAKRILAMSAVSGFGVKSFHQLLNELGSVEAIWQCSYDEFRSFQIKSAVCRALCVARDKYESQADSSSQRSVESWLEQEQRYFIGIEDANYPALLKEVYGAPPFLFVEGQIQALSNPAIAIVGSRNASSSGLQNASAFAQDLALSGYVVTSGLALGVDAAAHQGALEGNGATVAVLATGLDMIYPKKHSSLAEQIKDNGALVSEMQLGTMPVPANFPRRNRIISGLCRGVLVVEASLKSGSLITAKFALEQNREVYAIPGSIHNPMTKGCHSLIKQGAKLVESLPDILDDLHLDLVPKISDRNYSLSDNLTDIEQKIMEFIGFERRSFDDMVASLRLDVNILTQSLMALEINGLLQTVPGGYQRV